MKKRLLIVNSGGDCPGMNAVIRSIVKRATKEGTWEVIGSINSFDGVLKEPFDLEVLDEKRVAGIHVRGGTILTTNNKRTPFAFPVIDSEGKTSIQDVSDKLLYNLKVLNVDAVIHIGGKTAHNVSYQLYKKGLPIVGIPKTINNDLSVTDFAFGFQTAAQIATEAVDKLVTTASSHNRVLILEVMGRNAGWIALHAAIAGGAEVCLIPEIPFEVDKVIAKLNSRFVNGRGFANIVVAEGACPKGEVCTIAPGNISHRITKELKEHGFEADIRETILGHLQRGGVPNAFDRILATELGVKAFDLVNEGIFGVMAAHQTHCLVHVPLEDVIDMSHQVDPMGRLVKTAKGIGISFGE